MKLIVDLLVKQDINIFCIAPGSRSSPLTLAISEHPNCRTYVHSEERGLGFFALGLAKVLRKPIAIVVTSGTAVANLFPAVMEAYLSHIPLLLLTADRPVELRDTTANQTCDQTKIFGGFVHWYFDLPCYDTSLSAECFKSIISHAVFRALRPPQGPVHLNCMFRENLTDFSYKDLKPVRYLPTKKTLYLEDKKALAYQLSQSSRGVISVGELPFTCSLEKVLKLSETLQWPILSDPLSHLRTHEHSHLVTHFPLFLDQMPVADFVLHLGGRLVSKELLFYLSQASQCYLVASHPERNDSLHSVTDHVEIDPLDFIDETLPEIDPSHNTAWLESWQKKSEEKKKELPSFFSEIKLNELYPFYLFSTIFPDSWHLFIANSMPIRDAHMLLFGKKREGTCWANRGASGIDGNIATALGIAEATGRPLVAFLGDQTCLHDLSSFALLQKISTPIIFIIINNEGGGIFSFLPIYQKAKHFEQFWANPHGYQFEQVASCFSLSYFNPETSLLLEAVLNDLFASPRHALIEIKTDRKENLEIHKRLKKISEKICLTS